MDIVGHVLDLGVELSFAGDNWGGALEGGHGGEGGGSGCAGSDWG